MLNALRERLGEESFFQAGRRFMETFRGDGARTPDFRRFWNDVIQDGKFLNRWLDSPGSVPISPGIPVKNVDFDCKKRTSYSGLTISFSTQVCRVPGSRVHRRPQGLHPSS
jgi:aminopeptidase N